MSSTKTPTAAAQPLVSFTFNLPADIAELFTKAAKAHGNTAQQHAAAAVVTLLGADCEWYKLGTFNSVEQEPRAIAANAASADAEHVNVTLLKEDLDTFIESVEDLLHNDCGSRELSGVALADAIDKLTPGDFFKEGYRDRSDAAEMVHYCRLNAAQLRRLLAARGAVAVSVGGGAHE